MDKFDRYDVMTLIASACLSAFAYVAANNKAPVQYIDIDKPLVITVSLDN